MWAVFGKYCAPILRIRGANHSFLVSWTQFMWSEGYALPIWFLFLFRNPFMIWCAAAMVVNFSPIPEYQGASSTVRMCTPLCKSNGTFFSDMDINELTSVMHKYNTPVTKWCILICCWVNLVCIRRLIVKIMPEKHVWGHDSLMSASLYIFQLFEN